MANCKLVKRAKGVRNVARMQAPGDPQVTDFVLYDNQDDTMTVEGVRQDGAAADISSVATLAVASSDPAVLSADTPEGMTCKVHGLTPGTATLTFTATWNDGSQSFTIDLPCTLTKDPGTITGIRVTPGVPVVRS